MKRAPGMGTRTPPFPSQLNRKEGQDDEDVERLERQLDDAERRDRDGGDDRHGDDDDAHEDTGIVREPALEPGLGAQQEARRPIRRVHRCAPVPLGSLLRIGCVGRVAHDGPDASGSRPRQDGDLPA